MSRLAREGALSTLPRMRDPRTGQVAALLVDRCLDVQPGWQVVLNAAALARPLAEEVARAIGARGARALLRVDFSEIANAAWLAEAPVELAGTIPSIARHELEAMDAYVVILAPENTRDGSEVPVAKVAARAAARRPLVEPIFRGEKQWVGCYWPTPAMAQDANRSLEAFEEFYFGAMLVDWDELRRHLERIRERFDAGSEVRVVGDGTDIGFSLAGRHGKVDALSSNMPGGEVFYCPVEDSAEGVIAFSEYPACYRAHAVDGVRLRFAGGRVVAASATSDEEFLLATLDADEGARVLGEFGIGCNPGIRNHIRNTLFDEKIEGTIHLAVGSGFPPLGGVNVSSVHWDMVKDLRRGGRIELDGEVVQENGEWLI